jgi:hypothetical protein
MINKVGTVYDNARALLNDQIAAVFTNTVLAPYFGMAYDEIRQDCEDNNISITNETTDPITITTSQYDIGGTTGPALPGDFIEPIELWEIPANTTNDYMLMRRVDFLPKTAVKTAYLEVYQFNRGFIKFLGATGDIQVKMDYVCIGLPDFVDDNTMLKVRNMMLFLGYKTAGLAAMFIGENETRAAALGDLSVQAKDVFESITLKSKQNIVTRRRPFMMSYKQSGGTYGGR